MTELQLSSEWRRAVSTEMRMSGKYCDIYRIETGVTHLGVPDCYIVLDNECVWVEFKKLDAKGGVQFRPGQRLFATTVNTHGGRVVCIGLTDNKLCGRVRWDTGQLIGGLVPFKQGGELLNGLTHS